MALVPLKNGGVDNSDHSFCRRLEKEFTPFIGKRFQDVEEGIKFYKVYALSSGFDGRRATTKRWNDGTIQSKLVLCNREGFLISKKKKEINAGGSEIQVRKNKLHRIGCRACMRLFVKNGVVVVDRFNDDHNHELVSVENRQFQKLAKHLTLYHKRLIISNSRLNIGATKTFRICKELVNGFENVGASLNEFKNFQRDVKCFIHERDGQLFIDHFQSMKETRPGFYFDYDVDDQGSLTRAIWADGYGRSSYAAFGDAVSYDPTYSTNKYSMVFTPFTGVDNHRKSVTFCAALIAKEDYDSFKWVFSRFLYAMGGNEPSYIITDQDPGIIKSVNEVFKTARHRFCMWHIMNKVPSKFGVSRSDYHEFLGKLNAIIWDEDLIAADFDERWVEIMMQHGVGTGDWFEESFAIRKQWVMAHCKDLSMGRVMRTTQRSESENNFFKKFEHKSGTLVEFWMRYESAIDQQRHTHKRMDHENLHKFPKLFGTSDIEKHGAIVFTHVIFEEFQEEVKCSMTSCTCRGYRQENDEQITSVMDAVKDRIFEVRFSPDTNNTTCSCGLFHTKGIVCRHVIWLLSGHGLKKLPDGMVARRWRKDALDGIDYNLLGCESVVEKGTDEKQVEMSKLWSEIHETVGVISRLDSSYVQLSTLIREFREGQTSVEAPLSKEREIEELLGCKVSDDISVLPPKQSKNKGSGKRMTSSKSKAMTLAKKPKRLCNNCKQMAHHDKRNCPNSFVDSREKVVESSNNLEDDFDME